MMCPNIPEFKDGKHKEWYMDPAERFNALNNKFNGWECSSGSVLSTRTDGSEATFP